MAYCTTEAYSSYLHRKLRPVVTYCSWNWKCFVATTPSQISAGCLLQQQSQQPNSIAVFLYQTEPKHTLTNQWSHWRRRRNRHTDLFTNTSGTGAELVRSRADLNHSTNSIRHMLRWLIHWKVSQASLVSGWLVSRKLSN